MDIIDWSLVNWVDVSVYAAIVFVAALIGMLINKVLGDSVIVAALLTAILFGAGYVGWNYYPHGIDIGQTRIVGTAAPAPATPAPAELQAEPESAPAPATPSPSSE